MTPARLTRALATAHTAAIAARQAMRDLTHASRPEASDVRETMTRHDAAFDRLIQAAGGHPAPRGEGRV